MAALLYALVSLAVKPVIELPGDDRRMALVATWLVVGATLSAVAAARWSRDAS